MSSLDRAQSLADAGLFADALAVLLGATIVRDRRLEAEVLRAELLDEPGAIVKLPT